MPQNMRETGKREALEARHLEGQFHESTRNAKSEVQNSWRQKINIKGAGARRNRSTGLARAGAALVPSLD